MKSFVITLTVICIQIIVCNGVDVLTTSGVVRGTTIEVFSQSIDQFLGIPFAEPPIGDLRFAKPQPITTPLPGVIDATTTKNSCIQTQNGFFGPTGDLPMSEDCLILNIWTQSSNENSWRLKPVMFWIYGGGFVDGSIYQKYLYYNQLYNGSVLASQDVVLVAANYRLGPFGFLYANESTAPGNVGLYDQVLALEWVRDNIHRFGGDKNKITIFGESAGSISVSTLIFSPVSKGLFRRAILESGADLFNRETPIISAADSLLQWKALAAEVNCTDDNTWLSCLRGVSADDIMQFYSPPFTLPISGTEFLPLTAQEAFDQNQFNKDLDILAGVNKDEGLITIKLIFGEFLANNNYSIESFRQFVPLVGTIFPHLDVPKLTDFYLSRVTSDDPEVLKWVFSDFFGDVILKCPTYFFAKRYASHSTVPFKVYFYELTHAVSGTEDGNGIYHTAELPFVFGGPLITPDQTTEDQKFSTTVIKYWTNFAKYGTPDFGLTWLPMFTFGTQDYLVKDLNPNNKHAYFRNLFTSTCDGVWKGYY